MGKPTGFLEHPRRDPGYRPVKERIGDFKAVERQLPDDEIQRQAARCMDCGTPFCHAMGCPLKNVIPEMNDLAYRGQWRNAYDLLSSTSNFPEFTARICPALCEGSCVLGINDKATTIRQIEGAIIETAFARGFVTPRTPQAHHPQRVAVIGSGPAGLACADVLNQAGYRVTVYDRGLKPGGILRYGIPDFKLEKWVIDRRIAVLQAEGIVFEMGAAIGEDISARYLHSRFEAICLAGGAREPRDLNVPGRELQGIGFAMDFLTRQNLLIAGEPNPFPDDLSAKDKTVLVIGGGDTGSDCLGTAWRQGAKKVMQFEILPQPPPTRSEQTPWPQWPLVFKETSSHQEGGERRWCVTAQAFVGEAGCLTGVRGVEVDWTQSTDGKPAAMQIKVGTEFEINADMALLAMGFTGVKPSKLVNDLGVSQDQRGAVKVDANSQSSVPGVFVAGDMAQGASLVVRAIADGRRAAEGIRRYFTHHSSVSAPP